MKHPIKRCAPLVAISFLLAAMPAGAANSFYAAGDLVLYFQQAGGTNTVYADIGNAATLYRGPAAGPDAGGRTNFMNLNTTLTSAFGAGWASDPTIYAGLAGCWGTNATNTALQDGDPNRTLYVSQPRNGVGTAGTADSGGWTVLGNTAMTTGATGITYMNSAFKNSYDAVATVSPTSVSLIDETNPFSSPGIQGPAFGVFEGGVQQAGSASIFGTFGAAGTVEFALDIYRILGKNTVPGQVAGDLRVGSFEGTVTVGTNGGVSFTSLTAVPEPTTVMFTCLLTLSGLTLRNRRSA